MEDYYYCQLLLVMALLVATTHRVDRVSNCSDIPKMWETFKLETVAKFEVLWLYSQSSPQNLEAWYLLACHKQTICESSHCENCILYQFAKVFFSKVSHNAVVILQHNLRPIAVLPAHR